MQRLLSFPLKDPWNIAALRRQANAAPRNADLQIALGLALSHAGCTYEAAAILRPLRSRWSSSKDAPSAKAALDARAWWSKNWRQFARARHSGNDAAALALLGDRATLYWDLPPLLLHLGQIAIDKGELALAGHLFQRVAHLAERGLPKMSMAPFAYVAQAALVDVMSEKGDAAAALARHRAIVPNSGNAMAHEMQRTALLAKAGHLDEAMREAAAILVTASKHRTGYGKDLRLRFIDTSPDLAPLRRQAAWSAMLRDPNAYLRGFR